MRNNNIYGRVEQLERQEGRHTAAPIVLWPSGSDPDLYQDSNGREYRRGASDWPQNALRFIYNRVD